MPRPIYALDPDETWEVDYSLEVGRFRERIWLRLMADAEVKKEIEAGAQAKAALEVVRADLAAYEPRSGPIFKVGHIPAAKRPEIQGLGLELSKIGPDAKERPPGEFAWQREIVRWAVRGHRNLRRRSGAEVPFEAEAVSFDGEQRQVVSRGMLEVYGQSGLLTGLGGLGYLCLEDQRLSDDEKKA
jgi:hypothetical protein